MSNYGIKLVWASWHDEDVVGFSDKAKKKWQDRIVQGTRMLIYETSSKREGYNTRGVMAIVGEVEVKETWKQAEGKTTPTTEHNNPVGVCIIRRRAEVPPIPLERIRHIIADDKFPYQGQAWKPLTEEQYQALIAEWE